MDADPVITHFQRAIGEPLVRIGFDFQGSIRDRDAAFADRTGTQRLADLEHAILVSTTSCRSVRDLEVHAELRELAPGETRSRSTAGVPGIG